MKHLVVSDHIHGLLRVKAAEEGITINELVSRELYQKIEVVKTEPIQLKNKEIKPQDHQVKKLKNKEVKSPEVISIKGKTEAEVEKLAKAHPDAICEHERYLGSRGNCDDCEYAK